MQDDARRSGEGGGHDAVTLADRLLAEAVRYHESVNATDEGEAETKARETGGSFERRIVVRARAAKAASDLTAGLGRLRSAATTVVVIALVVVAAAGAATARAALGQASDETVNFYWALGSALGVESLALIIWFGLMIMKPAALASGSLGALVIALARRLGHALHRDSAHLAAARAMGGVIAGRTIGRWTFSAISHALWLVFLFACLTVVLISLSIRQHHFVWETTILSAETYVPLTRAIAAGPGRVGFNVPSEIQIRDSERRPGVLPPDDAKEAWSGLLVGSIVIYGLAPRLLLLVGCLWMRGRACRRYRLDTDLPGYARLRGRLMPVAASLGVIDGDDQAAPASVELVDKIEPPSSGPVAVLGFELESPPQPWPPHVHGVEWLDLGFVDDRAERHQVAGTIEGAAPMPRLVVIVASLTATPDRGVRSFLQALNGATRLPLALVLSSGHTARGRLAADQLETRIVDWRTLATAAGLDPSGVVEVDLEHLTAASAGRMATALGITTTKAPAIRHIEDAFARIRAHLDDWTGAPSLEARAALHRDLAELYDHRREGWTSLLRAQFSTTGDVVEQLRSGATRVVKLLPGRLRSSPKWIATGAATGALGCVAAAMLVTPAVLGSLPLWSGFGAAVSAAVAALRHEGDAETETPTVEGIGEAVAAAALFALLLDLQGRDEATITRVLDATIPGEMPHHVDASGASAWLDDVRHRYDLALASEATS